MTGRLCTQAKSNKNAKLVYEWLKNRASSCIRPYLFIHSSDTEHLLWVRLCVMESYKKRRWWKLRNRV